MRSVKFSMRSRTGAKYRHIIFCETHFEHAPAGHDNRTVGLVTGVGERKERTANRGVNGQEGVWAGSVLVGRASGVVVSRTQVKSAQQSVLY